MSDKGWMMVRSMLVLLVTVCLMVTPVAAQDIPRPLDSITFAQKSVLGLSADASHLAVWEPDGQLRLYDMQEFYRPKLTIQFGAPNDDIIRRIEWSADYTYLLLICYQHLYVMNTADGTYKQIENPLDIDQYTSARFFQDDRYIVAETGRDIGSTLVDFETFVWDASTLKLVLHLPAVEACPSELPTASFAAQVTQFMRESGFWVCTSHVEWNPDQSRYLTWAFWNSSPATTIKIYDTATLELKLELSHNATYSTPESPALADLGEVDWSPDGSKIVSVPQYGRDKINVWDAATGELLVSLTPLVQGDEQGWGAEDINPVFSADGNQLLTSGTNGYIFLWDVTSGALIRQLHFNDYAVRGAQWVYDNKLIVGWGLVEITTSNKGAMIWDAATGKLRALLVANGDPDRVVEYEKLHFLLVISSTNIDIYDLTTLAK